MATPLSATGRITIPITTQSGLHKVRHYVRGLAQTGGVWKVNTRTLDENDLDWEDAAEAMAHSISFLFATAASVGDAVLEKLEGIVWQPKAFHTVVIDQKGGSTAPASQATIVLRDVQFKKVKVVLLEINSGTLYHTNSYAALSGSFLNVIAEYTSDHVGTNAPYVWMVGRGNAYLNTAPFVGVTVAPNHKARRALGLT